MPIHIALVDDHPLTRKGIRDTLNENSSCRVIAETGVGNDAIALLDLHKPDVLVMDVEMPGLDGLTILARIKAEKREVKVVMLTMYDQEPIFRKAMKLGAAGYVLKESAIDDIVNAVLAVSRGKTYVSPSLGNLMMRRDSELTEKESAILRLTAEGKTTPRMAAELFLSERTIESHRRNICKKLGLEGKNALLTYAMSNKDAILRGNP
jgi:DNA-binding NarL/FixJ family response regulator